jgi:hypothetical protein
MLPEDAKARRQEALEKAMEQTQVDDHFKILKPEDKPIPYSDNLFKDASIQWLVETDQVAFTFSCETSTFSIFLLFTAHFCF